MYLDYWKLREEPFANTPDPKFFYASSIHREALERLTYAINAYSGCVMLTGEYGCGKTFLARTVLDGLDPKLHEVALINFPLFNTTEFLQEILLQQGKEVTNGSRLTLFHEISALAYENLQKGRQLLVVIDEAQLIEDAAVFEAIRLLLNIQLTDRFLITIFLVGQPELRERIMASPQLEQRIRVHYHLHHLSHEDVVGYIRHRLKVAGVEREIFTPEAYFVIGRISHGVARRINNICDQLLLDGAKRGVPIIDEQSIKKIV